LSHFYWFLSYCTSDADLIMLQRRESKTSAQDYNKNRREKRGIKVCICNFISIFRYRMPSVLWCCWLGIRKGIQPVNNWVVRCWHGYVSGSKCRFAYGPADSTATHYITISCSVNPDWFYLPSFTFLVLPFWCRLTRVVLDKIQMGRKTVVCVHVLNSRLSFILPQNYHLNFFVLRYCWLSNMFHVL